MLQSALALTGTFMGLFLKSDLAVPLLSDLTKVRIPAVNSGRDAKSDDAGVLYQIRKLF